MDASSTCLDQLGDGEYLLHTEARGIPHCSSLWVSRIDDTVHMIDGEYQCTSSFSSLQSIWSSCLDASTVVLFQVMEAEERVDGLGKDLLRLCAGSGAEPMDMDALTEEGTDAIYPEPPSDAWALQHRDEVLSVYNTLLSTHPSVT